MCCFVNVLKKNHPFLGFSVLEAEKENTASICPSPDKLTVLLERGELMHVERKGKKAVGVLAVTHVHTV